jgi:hypothetical protein
MDTKDKIAAIDRLIAQQMEYISTLETSVNARPDGEKQLENARMQLARLKEQKRRPATLCDSRAPAARWLPQGKPKQSNTRRGRKNFYVRAAPGLRAALDAEQQCINREHFKRKDSPRERPQQPRGRGDDGRTMRMLITDVAKENPHLRGLVDLWPHIVSAIEANGMSPIGKKHAGDVLRKLRRGK